MERPELKYAEDAIADFLRELVRLRTCGLVPEIQPFVTAMELEQGYLARAVKTYLLEAVRWGQENQREPPIETLTPLADALEPPQSQRPTAPPPPDWLADDEVTPLEEPGYERRLTGDITRLLRPASRTLRSTPPPPPIPELLSKQLRDRKRKP